ncbi:YopT-type cysteine protease domain-containing protein [Legionella drozanskii]|uniref:Peptidase C58 YopT-type domain-containing protein n=1 Tax=Legionella drozanskii LLAP-1 TaxID=1212489 RepID=A0A0W0SN89_9GAMM|nr:YopT-type cysteine protease domain-containing protein [Legionella drozanskii]KTC84748.1 hypothetical protein Ldro_2912 [Legionella drozanskii LLAP-1]
MNEKKEKTYGDIFKINYQSDPFASRAIFAKKAKYPCIPVDEILEKSGIVTPKFTTQRALIRELDSEETNGWCHGLSLEWLRMPLQFFEATSLVIKGNHYSPPAEVRKKVDKLYDDIMTGQYPSDYLSGVGQQDIDVILGVSTKKCFDEHGNGYTLNEWKKILQELVDDGYDRLSITAFTKKSHTVAIIIDTDKTYTFDPNDVSEDNYEHSKFTPLQMIYWIQKAFYSKFGLKVDRYMLMNLAITAFKSPDFLQSQRVLQDLPALTTEDTASETTPQQDASPPQTLKRKRSVFENTDLFFGFDPTVKLDNTKSHEELSETDALKQDASLPKTLKRNRSVFENPDLFFNFDPTVKLDNTLSIEEWSKTDAHSIK